MLLIINLDFSYILQKIVGSKHSHSIIYMGVRKTNAIYMLITQINGDNIPHAIPSTNRKSSLFILLGRLP